MLLWAALEADVEQVRMLNTYRERPNMQPKHSRTAGTQAGRDMHTHIDMNAGTYACANVVL